LRIGLYTEDKALERKNNSITLKHISLPFPSGTLLIETINIQIGKEKSLKEIENK
jgi:hypothetical protein